jgi:hypothetical protein
MLRFTLRLPDDLAAMLKAIAERESRSFHSQILYILRRFVEEHGR